MRNKTGRRDPGHSDGDEEALPFTDRTSLTSKEQSFFFLINNHSTPKWTLEVSIGESRKRKEEKNVLLQKNQKDRVCVGKKRGRRHSCGYFFTRLCISFLMLVRPTFFRHEESNFLFFLKVCWSNHDYSITWVCICEFEITKILQ